MRIFEKLLNMGFKIIHENAPFKFTSQYFGLENEIYKNSVLLFQVKVDLVTFQNV